jgi:hypothetical protein
MKSVVRITGQGKANDVDPRGVAGLPTVEAIDAKVALIQALIPLGLRAVGEVLEAEVTRLAGPRYRRTGGEPGHVRWSREQGSVYLLDQKLPITYQRVRDRHANAEVPLQPYQALQAPRTADSGLFRKVLLPASLPFLFTALRIGMARAVIAMITAELFFATVNLGKYMQAAQNRFDSAGLLAVLTILAVLGLLVQEGLKALEAHMLPWHVRH